MMSYCPRPSHSVRTGGMCTKETNQDSGVLSRVSQLTLQLRIRQCTVRTGAGHLVSMHKGLRHQTCTSFLSDSLSELMFYVFGTRETPLQVMTATAVKPGSTSVPMEGHQRVEYATRLGLASWPWVALSGFNSACQSFGTLQRPGCVNAAQARGHQRSLSTPQYPGHGTELGP